MSPGRSLQIMGCEDLAEKCKAEKALTFKDDLQAVLSKCRDVQVAILGMDLAIADYKGEGGIEFIEPPPILDDPGFFQEPDDSQSE